MSCISDIPTYREYYQDKFFSTHMFNKPCESKIRCQNCDITLDYHIEALEMMHKVFPNFKNNMNLNNKDHKSNLVDLEKHNPPDKKYSLKFKTSMFMQTFSTCEFKFIEPYFDDHDLMLNLNL